MKHLYSLLLVLPLLLTNLNTEASHAAGGELTYQHISGNTYRFTFKFFRDCTGISEPTSVPLCVYNLCTNTNVTTLYLPKITGNIPGTNTPNGTPTSSGCPGFQTSCQNPSSPVEGYAEWWYQGTYTLPAPGLACDQWRFNTFIGARNPSSNITGGTFYVEAFLNRRPVPNAASINNNSPFFTAAPIPYYCANQPTTFNNGMVEIDGDSTTFSSIQPKNQSGCAHVVPTNSNYTIGSYNPTTNPFNTGNTFNINPTNGAISFTPIGQQTPTITVRVDEYRNGILVGYVMRDIQMVILNCTTPNPTFAIDTNTISGGSQNANVIELCHGQNFNVCFDVISSSSTALLSMSDNSQQIIPASTMTYTGIGTDSVNGCFNWTPQLADTGLHIITITATDSSCAPPGILISQTFTLALNVNQSFPMTVTSANPSCGINNGTIMANSPGASTYLLQPNNTTSASGLFTGLGSGIYTVSVSNGGVCATPQTLTLQPPSNMSWTSVTGNNPNCLSAGSGSINAMVSGGQGTITFGINPPSAPNNTTGNFANLGPGTYTVSATDALNCTINTQVTLVAPAPLNLSSPTVTHTSCPTLSTGALSTSTTNSSNPPITYTINPGTMSNTIGNFTGLTAGSYTITATDAAGCTGTTVAAVNNPLVPIITNVSTVQPDCNSIFGSITVSAFSVFNPLTYTLNPGNQSNQSGSFFLLTGNTYTITVTDPGNCVATTTVVLNPGGALNVAATPTSAGCSTPTGSISTTVNGGNPAYSYNLMPGNVTNTTGNFSGLVGGNYTVTVTDANNCTGTSAVTINTSALPIWASTASGNPPCNNTTGWISGAATSSNAPMSSYTLMPINLTNSTGYFTNLAAGTYTLIATDQNNCDTVTSFTIVMPPPMLSGPQQSTNVSCNGGSDGSMQVSASGGTGALTYVLNPGAVSNTSGTYTNLSQGSYTITATDANNCTVSTTISITEPPVLSITNITSTTPSCVPGNDGSITITATGGTPTYQYNIGGANQSSNVFNNVGSGVYTVTVTDANNCTATTSVNIVAPNAPNITNAANVNVSCNGGNDGSITITSTGGTAPLNYNLMPGNVTNGTGSFTNLGQGNYTVTVTDANGCSASTSITITEPSQVIWDSTSNMSVSCNGGSDGSIQVSASGGTGTLTYVLNPGAVSNTSGTYTNLSQGSYTITATDANNCTVSTTISITQPPVLVWGLQQSTNISCNGGSDGSMQVSASGGTGALTYVLNPGAVSNTSGTYTNLSQGSYTITATDANNCTVSTTISITEPPVLSITNITSTTPSCVPGNDGSITITATGGTPTYQYNIGGANQSSNVFNNVGSGVYTVTVTDANNCTATTSVNIVAPNAPNITNAANVNVSCNGGNDGSITITSTGGTAPLNYNLMPGNVTNGTGSFTNLGQGNYTVTVTDANGCSASTSITITEPSQVIWDSTSNMSVSCNGGSDGSIQVSASGGTGTLTYVLNPGAVSNTSGTYTNLSQGSYTITATDANNCTVSTTISITQPPVLVWGLQQSTNISCNGGSDGSMQVSASGGTGALTYVLNPGAVSNTSGTYTNLSQGSYTITATDANNCTVSTTISITEPPVLSITNITSTTPSCVPGNDGSITITATGGTPTYQYNIGGANQSSNVFNNVGSGVYTVTVTDANNCTATTSVNIVTPNSPIITNLMTTAASCVPGNDGTITVTASGGLAPYQYSSGGTNQASNVLTNLAAGNFTITVTDANGCSSTSLATVQTQPSPNIDSVSVTDASCNPGCDGTASITASGGTPVYMYSLVGPFQSGMSFTNLCTGAYLATVQDGNGCTDTMSFIISTANGPTITSVISDSVNCNGDSNGGITIASTGGAAPINYNLMPGNVTNTTGSFQGLTANTYTVSVSDANGCTITTLVDVFEPAPVAFDSVSGSGSSCSGSSNGTIFVSNVGGTGSFGYQINPAATFTAPGTFSNLVGNTNYTITATDANGCSLTTVVFIASPQAMSVTSATATDVSCNGANDGTAQVAVTGGTIPYWYNILPPNTTNGTGNFTGLGGGAYTITVTDANNCTISTTLSVAEPAALQITNVTASDVTCAFDTNGSIQVTATGGVPGLNYNLMPGNITNGSGGFGNLWGTTYTVTVTDANNCSLSTAVVINEPNQLIIDSLVPIHVSCSGADDGQITVYSNGGNGGNSYNIIPNNITNSTGVFNNLLAQQYVVTVTDVNNCSVTDSLFITEPNPLTASQITTNVSCFGGNNGTISITPNGGIPAYSYILTPGNIVNTTGQYIGLSAGTYSVTVVDANNCSTIVSGIPVTQPPQLLVDSLLIENVRCFGDNTGRVKVYASGGKPQYIYTINPTGGVQNTPGDFTDMYADNYYITVTDANNCTVNTSVIINQNPEIIFDDIVLTNPLCHGDDNGSIELSASGGVGTIGYALNNGPITQKRRYQNLIADYYLVSAVDSLNCRVDSGVVLVQPDPVEIRSIDLTHLSCKNAKDGKAVITATGGLGYYTFYVRPGIRWNRIGSFYDLDKGVYTIKVVDTNQCEADSSFIILENQNPMFSTITKKDLACQGYGNEGEAEINISGGERPFTYLWSSTPRQQTPQATGLRYGWYYVDVVDARGCNISDSVYINPGECCTELFLPNAFSPNGDGNNDEFRVISTAGIELEQFEIYNRWGQRVWDTYTYYDGWEGDFQGEPAMAGTYYYVYRYRCITDGKLYIKKGDIILVR